MVLKDLELKIESILKAEDEFLKETMDAIEKKLRDNVEEIYKLALDTGIELVLPLAHLDVLLKNRLETLNKMKDLLKINQTTKSEFIDYLNNYREDRYFLLLFDKHNNIHNDITYEKILDHDHFLNKNNYDWPKMERDSIKHLVVGIPKKGFCVVDESLLKKTGKTYGQFMGMFMGMLKPLLKDQEFDFAYIDLDYGNIVIYFYSAYELVEIDNQLYMLGLNQHPEMEIALSMLKIKLLTN